jgi:antitoxin CptB
MTPQRMSPNPLPAPSQLDTRRKRILFRAQHRGTHENDLLIGGYVAPRIAAMDEAQLTEIEALMELPDPELADWLSGRRPIPDEINSEMLRDMRAAAGR